MLSFSIFALCPVQQLPHRPCDPGQLVGQGTHMGCILQPERADRIAADAAGDVDKMILKAFEAAVEECEYNS